ncbi:MAG TPA: D-2-hydroxyacid dehydrogenase [Verrucomicrobiae bacterium]|jgi:glycerate dehydrogenase
MNIVALDGHTLNPGDLSWEPLRALGTCTILPRIKNSEVVPAARDAEIILTNKVPITREQMAALPRLKYIGVTATGYNIVDVAAARERKIVVTNIPAYGTASVAQMTFALLLELTQHAGHHSDTVRQGRWAKSPDFCYWDFPLIELEGLTMGLIGFGNIGQAVARLADAFGMKVNVLLRQRDRALPSYASAVDLNTIFQTSDVLSLHCPLTPDTKDVVNAKSIGPMKTSAFLLNTSRGALINDQALADALNEDRLAGAGLDVLSVEPPLASNPLLQAKNCIITPHIAWATRAARARLMDVTIRNVAAFLHGKPQNVVS